MNTTFLSDWETAKLYLSALRTLDCLRCTVADKSSTKRLNKAAPNPLSRQAEPEGSVQLRPDAHRDFGTLGVSQAFCLQLWQREGPAENDERCLHVSRLRSRGVQSSNLEAIKQ